MSFNGKWKLVKSEGFEEYLKARGTPDEAIGLVTQATVYMDVEEKGDNIKVKTYTDKRTLRENDFTVGKEFETKSMTGTPVNNIVTRDGKKLVHKASDERGTETVTREIQADGTLKATMQIGSHSATRYFQKA